MFALTDKRILQRSVMGSVDEVVERLLSILRGEDFTVFAVVDHSGEGANVGLQMPIQSSSFWGVRRPVLPSCLLHPAALSIFRSSY